MKKKVALPVIDGKLSEHFGHARLFQIFEIEDDTIQTSYAKEPPPHQEGALPRWLAEEKVSDLLVGGIGPKAVEILYANGINVYVNVEVDTADNIALDFINGSLKFGQNYCHH